MSWRVDYARALLRWFETASPSEEQSAAVVAWIEALRVHGPPDDAVHVFADDDLYLAREPTTGTVVSFLAIAQDRIVIVREIG